MLTFEIQATRDTLGARSAAQLLYVLVHVTPPERFRLSQMPLNVGLVIDRSTSMQGERLERVKAAAALLVEKLSADDVLSVIAFSDRAEVVLPASHVRSKEAVLSRLRSIVAFGGTEIFQGLNVVMREMRKADLEQYLNHIILLTDGQTYGDENACLQLAQQAAAARIGISGFGLGAEWNDQFLDRLVAPSGGQSVYVESAAQIVNSLQQRLQSLGAVYAHNLRLLTSELPASVRLQYGLKFKPFAQPLLSAPSPDSLSGDVNLGTVEARAPLVFVLELAVEPLEAGDTLDIPLIFYADIPSEMATNHRIVHHLSLSIVADPPRMSPPPALVEAVRVLNLYRLNEKAWQEIEAGQLETATTRMQRLTTRLLESGYTQLAEQAQIETERLATLGTLSLDGRKRLRFGTRALLTKTLTLNHDD